MPTTTYILDIDDFLNRADLTDFIRTDRLKIYLGIVQEQACLETICKEMYDAIIDELAQGGEDYLSDIYVDLLPYLKDFLVYRTYARYLVNADFTSTAAGMRKPVDSVSEQLTSEEKQIIVSQAKNDAAYYQDRMIAFLETNVDSYTLWKNSRCNCNRFATHPGNSIRFSGKTKYDKPNKVRWT